MAGEPHRLPRRTPTLQAIAAVLDGLPRKGEPHMNGITLDQLGTPPAQRADLPAPTPAPNEALIRVRASSVNPVDNAIAAGMLKDMVAHEFPITLGRDYAGIVQQVGAEVTGFSAGEEVFGFIGAMNPSVHAGSWAELIVVPETMSVARKPDGVDLATAGAAPSPRSPRSAPSTRSHLTTATRCSSSAPPAVSAARPSSSPPPPGRP
jgi:hypothetical protein